MRPSTTLRALWPALLLLCGPLPLCAEQFGLFSYELFSGASEAIITSYPKDATGPVEIPSEIAGKPVTTIGRYSFYRCTGLTRVTIPSNVTTINTEAFYGCTGLTSVTIPSSATIGDRAFSGCTGLSAINVEPGNLAFSSESGVLFNAAKTEIIDCPDGKTGSYAIPSSVTTIRSGAFDDCIGLTSVTIPSSVTSIGSGAFCGCTGLTSVTLPQGLTTLGSSMFAHCTGLTSVTIPSTVATIGYDTFSRCTGLTNVTLPQGLTTLGSSMFAHCTGLTSVTIPSSVTSIGTWAFSGCTGLTSVTLPQGLTTLSSSVFSGCPSLARGVFLGNAPFLEGGAFAGAAPGFTIYYLSDRTGFTSPTWQGHPANMIEITTWPAAEWLLEHNLWYDTALHTDPDGDGVSLFLAWSLDLDPTRPQHRQLPAPVLTGMTPYFDSSRSRQ